jgi:hypothetical protein
MRKLLVLALAAACGSSDDPGPSPGNGTAGARTTPGTDAAVEERGPQDGCLDKLEADKLPTGDLVLAKECGTVKVIGEVTIDASLTIEPGVTVQFGEGASLWIGYEERGTLIARGTEREPIVFTSAPPEKKKPKKKKKKRGAKLELGLDEVDAGVDLEDPADEADREKRPGWWKGVFLSRMSKDSILEHVVIEFAGSDGDDDGRALKVEGEGTIVRNCQIRSAKGWGIWAADLPSLAAVEATSFRDLSVAAMRIAPANLPAIGVNRYHGDTVVEISGGELAAPAVLREGGVYRLVGEVQIHAELTVQPGALIEAVTGGGLAVGVERAGALVARGSAGRPIRFTAVNKRKGSWKGITLGAHAERVVVQQAVVEYAIADADRGAIHAEPGAAATIAQVRFEHLAGVGVSVRPGANVTTRDLKAIDATGTEYRGAVKDPGRRDDDAASPTPSPP